MSKKKLLFLPLLFVISTSLLAGCAAGQPGATGPQGEQGIQGEVGPQGEKGDKGDTGAAGTNGADGHDGQTPYIGENGNWWIGTTDTGVKAEGTTGATGAQGEKGDKGDTGAAGTNGADGQDGKSAYELYLEAHPDYEGDEAQWIDDLVNGRLSTKEECTVIFDSDGGSPVETQKVKKGEKASRPVDPVRECYDFNGWYVENERWSFIGYVVTEDIILCAQWNPSANTNYVNAFSSDNSLGKVIGEGRYHSNSSVTLTAEVVGDNVFEGWYSDSEFHEKIGDSTSYSFLLGEEDETVYAKFVSLEKYNYNYSHGITPTIQENIITYGRYPQTYVSDTTITSELDKISSTNSLGYIEYDGNEYKKVKATPYQSGYKFSNNTTTIESGSTYYFKVEPIKWIILENSDGTYKLMSEYVLTNSFYYTNTSKRTIDGQTIYPNNYEYSTIRDFINNEFYNEAFALDDSLIQTTLVDNSASTTNSSSNSYACNNTNDKVYLLSYKDLINTSYGFNSYTARRGQTTDYARATGTWMSTDSPYYGNTFWWSRSPSYGNSYNAYGVNYLGDFYNYYVYSADYGVRPALTIKIV